MAFVSGGVAIVAAILAFGVGHVYQGVRGVFATGAAGALAAMAVYLLTESLVTPIVLHAALDLANGFTIYTVRFGPDGDGA